MNNEQKDLLLLLRCALWQDKKIALSIKNICWDKVYQLAKEQCLVGIIADSFQFLNNKQIDKNNKLKWLGYIVKLEQKNGSLNKLVYNLFLKFNNMQLSPILMKGQAFAENYPYPLHRQCGDIDIYFKNREDCNKAVEWAANIDKVAAKSYDNKRERKHFTFSIHGNIVELHYFMCLFENSRLHKRLQQIIDKEFADNEPSFVYIEEKQIETVPYTLSVLHQIIHISRHLLEAGIGLRQICDLALYLDKYYDVIDKEKLNGYLNELQLMTVAKSIGYILVNFLGLKKEKMPFSTDKQYTEFIIREVFDGGNFGKKNITYRINSQGLRRKVISIFYFYKRCKKYQPLMPLEAKSYFLKKIILNIRLMTKHNYLFENE